MSKSKKCFTIYRMTCLDYFSTLEFWVVLLSAILFVFALFTWSNPAFISSSILLSPIEVVLLPMNSSFKYLIVICILLAFLGKAPFFAANDQFLISRTDRKSWIWAKLLFVATILLLFYVILYGLIFSAYWPSINFKNWAMWTPASADQQGSGNLYALSNLNEDMLETYTPLQALLIFLPLSYLLMLILSLIVLCFNIWHKQTIGIIVTLGICTISYFINVLLESYARWGLTLHVLPYYHKYTGVITDSISKHFSGITESYVIYLISTTILIILSVWGIKLYDFHQHDKGA